jgi:hypothetical protein
MQIPTTEVNDKLNQFLIKISKEKSNLITVMNSNSSKNTIVNNPSLNNSSTNSRIAPNNNNIINSNNNNINNNSKSNSTNNNFVDNNLNKPKNASKRPIAPNSNNKSSVSNSMPINKPHSTSNNNSANQDIISNSIYLYNILSGNCSSRNNGLNSIGSSVSNDSSLSVSSGSSSGSFSHSTQQQTHHVSSTYSPTYIQSISSSDNGYSTGEEHTINLNSSPSSAIFELSNHASTSSPGFVGEQPEALAKLPAQTKNGSNGLMFQSTTNDCSSTGFGHTNSESNKHLLVVNMNRGKLLKSPF